MDDSAPPLSESIVPEFERDYWPGRGGRPGQQSTRSSPANARNDGGWGEDDSTPNWGDTIQLRPGPAGSGSQRRKGAVVPDNDGWGVGAEAWSAKDDESVAGSVDSWGVGAAPWSTKDDESVRAPSDDGWGVGAEVWSNKDNDSVVGSNDVHEDASDAHNHLELPTEDDNQTPRGGSPTNEVPKTDPPIISFERSDFNWADEPADMTAFDFTANVGADTNPVAEASGSGSSGWTKISKKSKNGRGRGGANQPGEGWGTGANAIPIGRGRGRGRGRGQASASSPNQDSPQEQPDSWRSTSQPPASGRGRGKGKGKQAQPSSPQEELPVYNDVSEWANQAWDTSTEATW